MTDLSQALAEINAIRAQVARGTQFRGYGPVSVAATGVLALTVAAAQSLWFKEGGHEPTATAFLSIWIATAAVAVGLSTLETIFRSRRVHSGFANEMIRSALEQFLPASLVGVLLTGVLLIAAPADLWMLPGVWELMFSLGIFASCRFLPPRMFAVAIWYLGCGLTCLMIGSRSRVLSPWEMGIPFGMGQLFVATVLRFGDEETLEERQ